MKEAIKEIVELEKALKAIKANLKSAKSNDCERFMKKEISKLTSRAAELIEESSYM